MLHVDMDAFFASVEQLDHPEWRGLPVVVGGSPEHRGVVATASYEARAYGVRSAMPAARAARLLPPGAVWTRGHFDRYAQVSRQVFDVLRTFSPHVQVASVDEAFVDVTPGAHSPHPIQTAVDIQRGVDTLGITCSIGLAPNKTVAKIASDLDKPHGLTIVWPGDEATFLAPLPIERLPGIGPATATRLHSLGIHLLGDLAALDDATATQVLGSHGPAAVARAAGVDMRDLHVREPTKSISNERTFATDLRASDVVRTAVEDLADHVAARLRRSGLAGRTVHLKIRYADFTTTTVQQTMPEASDASHTIRDAALDLLGSAWAAGVGVRLLGVGVTGFREEARQLGLPLSGDGDPPSRHEAVERVVDQVRERFGEGAVHKGGGSSARRSEAERYGPSATRNDSSGPERPSA